MTLVVDASVVVAALIDPGPVGTWAESLLVSCPLAAPHLMPAEAANILRRSALAGEISADVASLAHDDLISLRLEHFPYLPFAARVWELRSNVRDVRRLVRGARGVPWGKAGNARRQPGPGHRNSVRLRVTARVGKLKRQ